MTKLDYLYLHTDKSEEWARGYLTLTKLAWFSSFFRYEYSNLAIFTMLDIEDFSVNKWLNTYDDNPFFGTVNVDKDIGFVVGSNGIITNTNVAKVILIKDEYDELGYKVYNCFPCLPAYPDYRSIHLQRFFITHFNTEWVLENNRSTDYQLVVERYKKNSDGETIYHTIQELRQVVDCFYLGEEKLSEVLTAEFCCVIRPEAYGLNYKQFILEILSVMEEGGKHEYFEKINSRRY